MGAGVGGSVSTVTWPFNVSFSCVSSCSACFSSSFGGGVGGEGGGGGGNVGAFVICDVRVSRGTNGVLALKRS